jgi:hypothetical protein
MTGAVFSGTVTFPLLLRADRVPVCVIPPFSPVIPVILDRPLRGLSHERSGAIVRLKNPGNCVRVTGTLFATPFYLEQFGCFYSSLGLVGRVPLSLPFPRERPEERTDKTGPFHRQIIDIYGNDIISADAHYGTAAFLPGIYLPVGTSPAYRHTTAPFKQANIETGTGTTWEAYPKKTRAVAPTATPRAGTGKLSSMAR